MPESSSPDRLSWSGFFRNSTKAIFVISGKTGRLRYVNPAWEELTKRKLAQVRGTKIATQRRSVSRFWRAMCPPEEVLLGQSIACRRAVPPHENGPPWWDIQFVPLPTSSGFLGIIGIITPVGEPLPKGQPRWPDWLADLQLKQSARYKLESFDGETLARQRVLSQARLAATHSAPLWLDGEPGTGKRTLAQAIHNASSVRNRAFTVVDAQALKTYLVESLLFSPGGIAQSTQVGTVYFREAVSLTQELQARVLNWANRPGCPRLMFGSTQPADEALFAGILLPVFYTRFASHQIKMVAVRDCLDDLPKAAATLLLDPTHGLPEQIRDVLRLHTWPGNFRELRAVLRKLEQAGMQYSALPRRFRELQLHVPPPASQKSQPLDVTLSKIEEQIVRLGLSRFPHKPSMVCEQLGITRTRLNKIVARLDKPAE